MPLHGELMVKFVIFSINGADITLKHHEAVTLHRQLGIALNLTGKLKPLKPPKTKPATKVVVTK